MGHDGAQKTPPDLFPPATVVDASRPLTRRIAGESAEDASRRQVLPKDLPNALKYLEAQELDRLLAAVLNEAERRGRLPRNVGADPSRAPVGSGEIAPTSLKRGQMNAVRAAFKAGVTLSRIARQFGISQSDVRKALLSDEAKR